MNVYIILTKLKLPCMPLDDQTVAFNAGTQAAIRLSYVLEITVSGTSSPTTNVIPFRRYNGRNVPFPTQV